MCRRLKCVLIALFSAIILSGCGNASGGTPAPTSTIGGVHWSTMSDCVTNVVVWLNDGTNWMLNKSQVSVIKFSDVRPGKSVEGHVADFRIVVVDGTNTFDVVAKDVQCDELGIPTDASVDVLREAVEKIKTKIKRLQG